MLSYFELRKGTRFLLEEQPFEVLDFQQVYKAQDAVVAKVKLKNLLNGKVVDKTFHQGDFFEEANLDKVDVKFIYSHRGTYCFARADNPSNRFEMTEEKIGDSAKFLKSNSVATGIVYEGEFISIALPVKVILKVTDAPPGVKGERSQAGTKPVTLETGAIINAPLFVENGDMLEVNTETGEYVRRVEK
jgi:elongation factor P